MAAARTPVSASESARLREEHFPPETPQREGRAPFGAAHYGRQYACYGGSVDASAAHRRAHVRPDAVPHRKSQSLSPAGPAWDLRRITAFSRIIDLTQRVRPDAAPCLGFEGQGRGADAGAAGEPAGKPITDGMPKRGRP